MCWHDAWVDEWSGSGCELIERGCGFPLFSVTTFVNLPKAQSVTCSHLQQPWRTAATW